MQKIALGQSNFKGLREDEAYFVDKSLFIKDIINDSYQTILLPRPRRFGKTLNISMLYHFFEKTKEDKSYLFKGLKISQEPEFKKHFSRYPVIFLTFKDIKEDNFEIALNKIKKLISDEFEKHLYLLEKNFLTDKQKLEFNAIYNKNGDLSLLSNALILLSKWLFEYTGEKVVILIDEYDTPIHAAYDKNYYDDMISFCRGFLSAGLKDNDYLYKGVLTGILRVAKESIFSGLNNLGTYTILNKSFSTRFGFTEEETFKMLDDYNLSNFKKDVKLWYDGYIFGGHTIYNPWSILNFVSSLDKRFETFWANTSSNDIVRDLIVNSSIDVKEEFELLLQDKPITKQIETAIVFRDIENQDTALYSLLTFSGYLKPYNYQRINLKDMYSLLIPNLEVKTIFQGIIQTWFRGSFQNKRLELMLSSLTKGDIETFTVVLEEFILETLSYFDIAGKKVEKVYQAFVLGLLVNLSHTHQINSNKESGLGRYDICIIPKDKTQQAIIMELKVIDKRKKETKIKALNSAVKQIIEKKYKTEVLKSGVKEIVSFGLVFDGKKVWTKIIDN